MTGIEEYEARIAALEQQNKGYEERLRLLESKRPGRKALPIVVSEVGVCGVDPARDSSICEDASLYRKQRGCRGAACQAISTAYYANYRSKEGT